MKKRWYLAGMAATICLATACGAQPAQGTGEAEGQEGNTAEGERQESDSGIGTEQTEVPSGEEAADNGLPAYLQVHSLEIRGKPLITGFPRISREWT